MPSMKVAFFFSLSSEGFSWVRKAGCSTDRGGWGILEKKNRNIFITMCISVFYLKNQLPS
jgi:hypothetical protein